MKLKNRKRASRLEFEREYEQPFPTPRTERLRRREWLACRATHWKSLLENATIEPWRHPYNQLGRMSYLHSRCRYRCRRRPAVVLFLGDEEELRCRSEAELRSVLVAKLEQAMRVFLELVLPRRARTEACRSRMREMTNRVAFDGASTLRHWGPPMEHYPPRSSSGL